jgi:hypothetical protein
MDSLEKAYPLCLASGKINVLYLYTIIIAFAGLNSFSVRNLLSKINLVGFTIYSKTGMMRGIKNLILILNLFLW